MTPRDIIALGVRMRQAQTQYFRTRTTADLDASKRLERDFDRACKEAREHTPGLFDRPAESPP